MSAIVKFDPSKLEEPDCGTWKAILDRDGQKTIDEAWERVVERVTMLHGRGLRHVDIVEQVVGDVFDSGTLAQISIEYRNMRVTLAKAMVCQAIDRICLGP